MNQNIQPRLHHVCYNITPDHLEVVIELFELLGCGVVFRPADNPTWIMLGQEQLNFALQITESATPPEDDLSTKSQAHIAFISDNPQKIIDRIESWAQAENIRFRQDGWSEKERYFDLPEIFVNFVIEIMHTSIEEE